MKKFTISEINLGEFRYLKVACYSNRILATIIGILLSSNVVIDF